MADNNPSLLLRSAQSSKKRVGTTRQRSGCLTCRQRKKRCDDVRSICGGCRRLNLVCHWEPRRKIPIDISTVSTSQSPPDSTFLVLSSIPKAPDPTRFGFEDAADDTRSAIRRVILRYYMHTFTAMLTTNLENNGFSSVLLPMAIESPPVLDTLIAWSSSHLAMCHKAYHVRALEQRSLALTSFARSIHTGSLSPELSLAGCLVFCSMEAILGDTSGWYEHLVGTAQVIQLARGPSVLSRTLEGRWLLRNFAYHDILMSVTMDREPLISGIYWMEENDGVADSYFGLASQPMASLSQIRSTNADMTKSGAWSSTTAEPSVCNYDLSQEGANPSLSKLSLKMFSERAFTIESELQTWICEHSEDRSLVSLAEAYRCAALIHLYRVIRRHFPSLTPAMDHKIARQVFLVIQHVRDMPLQCLPECTLLFPLFMAGGEAHCEGHIVFLRQRMLEIANFRRFGNVNAALSVLEELWRLKGDARASEVNQPVDWLDILRWRGWKLALS